MTEREPVGTLADEAARLFSVAQAWLNEQTGSEAGPTAEHEHGHDSAVCRWCPLCSLARLAKATSPEVREHLTQAAVSLALAVQGLLADGAHPPRQAVPLEKIDLTEE